MGLKRISLHKPPLVPAPKAYDYILNEKYFILIISNFFINITSTAKGYSTNANIVVKIF